MNFGGIACFKYTHHCFMKSFNPIWWICLVLFLLPKSWQAFGQQAGELDTSFVCRPNYGALFPIEKSWVLADGSILCYQEGSNYFSGIKTGSFFKIDNQGNLVPGYQAPIFSFWCVPGFCICDKYRVFTSVNETGEVFFYSQNGVSINGNLSENHFFRLSSLGAVLSNTPQAPADFYFDFGIPDYQPFLSHNRLVGFHADTMKIFDFSLQVDTSLPYLIANFSLGFPYKTLVQSKIWKIFGFFDGQKYTYVPLNLESKTFLPTIIPEPLNGVNAYPIEIDTQGRIYEWYQSADTLNGNLYDRILRRFPNGIIDSSYHIRVQQPVWDDINYPNYQLFKVDSFGVVTNFRRDGVVFPQVAPNSYPHFNYSEITGGWYWNFDNQTGNLIDSLYFFPYQQRHKISGGYLSIGPDAMNRWKWSRQDSLGNETVQKQTRFGANGPVRRVLSDGLGRAVVYGSFSQFDTIVSPKIARILPNGIVDGSFICKAFSPEENISLVYFSFWKNDDPNLGFLAVNQKKGGSLNRFLYHILPNGDIDSSYGAHFQTIFGADVTTVLCASQMNSGAVLICLKRNQPDSSNYTFFVRLLPDGNLDPTFGLKVLQGYLPGLPLPYYSYGPDVESMVQIGPNKWLIEVFRSWYDNDPPCKSESAIELLNTRRRAFTMDSLGIIFESANTEVYNYSYLESQFEGSAIPFVAAPLDIFPGPENNFYRLKSNFELDSAFHLRKQNGPLGNFSPIPLVQTKKGDYFFSNLKTTSDGFWDSTFVFGALPRSIAEPDTSHLYLGGNFLFFNNQVRPFLVRVHNKTSQVTAVSNLWKGSQVSLFPNPIGETLNIAGWQAGMNLRITSVEGKILFEGPVEKESATARLGLRSGLYFWTVTQHGQLLGGGRLIR